MNRVVLGMLIVQLRGVRPNSWAGTPAPNSAQQIFRGPFPLLSPKSPTQPLLLSSLSLPFLSHGVRRSLVLSDDGRMTNVAKQFLVQILWASVRHRGRTLLAAASKTGPPHSISALSPRQCSALLQSTNTTTS